MASIPKVTIIVPVYNGESYISRCLTSLVSQSLIDIEIIIVDDGSIDGTKVICTKFSKTDRRVQYLWQSHKGVSAARNLALKIAKGMYLAFCDADDSVPKGGIEALFKASLEGNADLVIGDYLVVNSCHTRLVNVIQTKTPQEFLATLLDGRNHSALWNKLIKRSKLGNIRFQESIRYAEDQVLLVELMRLNSFRMVFLSHPVYTHYVVYNSLTQSGDLNLLDFLSAKLFVGEIINADEAHDSIRQSFIRGVEHSVVSVFRNIDASHSMDTRDEISQFRLKLIRQGWSLKRFSMAQLLLVVSGLPRWTWMSISVASRAFWNFRACLERTKWFI